MKILSSFILALLLMVFALPCIGALSVIQKDGALLPIQGFAPDPVKDVHLGSVPKLVDMSNDIAWQTNAPVAGCLYKNLSTTTNVGYYKPLATAGTDGRVVNHKKHGNSFGNHTSAFTVFTNCTGAVLERQ